MLVAYTVDTSYIDTYLVYCSTPFEVQFTCIIRPWTPLLKQQAATPSAHAKNRIDFNGAIEFRL